MIRQKKLFRLTFLFMLLACTTAEARGATHEAPPTNPAASAVISPKTARGTLSCFSIKLPNESGPSCDDLCAAKDAACVGVESVINPHDCGLPTYGNEYCRCCEVK